MLLKIDDGQQPDEPTNQEQRLAELDEEYVATKKKLLQIVESVKVESAIN